MSGKTDMTARKMYDDAMKVIISLLVIVFLLLMLLFLYAVVRIL